MKKWGRSHFFGERVEELKATRPEKMTLTPFLFCAALLLSLNVLPARASVADSVGTRACAALTARVDAFAGSAPVLLRSYDAEHGSGEPDDPALHTAAFVYDNSLAAIALLACDRPVQAARIGAALRSAATHDARLRNAYRAGLVEAAPLPNGWWDARKSRWSEDAYQNGSATGNVAWTALALLTLDKATGEAGYNDAAEHLAQWVVDHASETSGDGGFSGGVFGFDAKPQRLNWRSTEHNIDLVALFDALVRVRGAKWQPAADAARRFVTARWDTGDAHLLIGTKDDGTTPNRDTSALDVQLWAQLLSNVPASWRGAVAYAERAHRVPGGFDFNADHDGLWLEGTAQAALVYRTLGREADAQALFATIDAQFSTGGMVYATREARISTGLALGADSKSADFYYFRRPHLAATAWAALAARRRNPFLPEG